MLGKLVRDVVDGAAEVAVSPLTLSRKVPEKIEREIAKATEPKGEKDV